jgi:hydroxymethylglutaryl-CoA lyase
MLHGMGIATGIDLDALVACASKLSAVVGHEMPSKYTKAALGARAKSATRSTAA